MRGADAMHYEFLFIYTTGWLTFAWGMYGLEVWKQRRKRKRQQ